MPPDFYCSIDAFLSRPAPSLDTMLPEKKGSQGACSRRSAHMGRRVGLGVSTDLSDRIHPLMWIFGIDCLVYGVWIRPKCERQAHTTLLHSMPTVSHRVSPEIHAQADIAKCSRRACSTCAELRAEAVFAFEHVKQGGPIKSFAAMHTLLSLKCLL